MRDVGGRALLEKKQHAKGMASLSLWGHRDLSFCSCWRPDRAGEAHSLLTLPGLALRDPTLGPQCPISSQASCPSCSLQRPHLATLPRAHGCLPPAPAPWERPRGLCTVAGGKRASSPSLGFC